MSIDVIENFFKDGVTHFLTINPYKNHKDYDKYQNISKVYDKLRRRCSKLFIVREQYKLGGYHYHAIVQKYVHKPVKGLRVHAQRVGGKVGVPNWDPNVKPKEPEGVVDVRPSELYREFPSWITFNPSKLVDWIFMHNLKIKGKMTSHVTGLKTRDRVKKRRTHLGRVVRYMFKEHPLVQYQDWILKR